MQWQAPDVKIKKEVKYLGVCNANPSDYVQRYGTSLFSSNELPDFVTQIKPPNGIVQAADQKRRLFYELEGEIDALKLVDLDKEGLGEYKEWLRNRGVALASSHNSLNNFTGSSAYTQQYQPSLSYVAPTVPQDGAGSFWSPGVHPVNSSTISNSEPAATLLLAQSNNEMTNEVRSTLDESLADRNSSVISQIFSEFDLGNGKISLDEAEKVLIRVNSRLDRGYGDDEVKAFLSSLAISDDGLVDLNEFKQAFEKILH